MGIHLNQGGPGMGAVGGLQAVAQALKFSPQPVGDGSRPLRGGTVHCATS